MNVRAGTPQKGDDRPGAGRETGRANGGKAGMTVDKEPGMIDGKAVYEAGIKGKDGNISDLVITDDGKLVTIKSDDSADAAAITWLLIRRRWWPMQDWRRGQSGTIGQRPSPS
mgnify:CR=1 FL=1